MALSQKLEIRQGQSLVMTPQLQQAIKLLQLSNLELTQYVEQELERNPLLERDESEPVQSEERSASDDAPAAATETLDTALAQENFSKGEDMDAERSDLYAEDSSTSAPGSTPLSDWTTLRSGPAGDGDENALERTLAQAENLKDHLTYQLSIAALTPDRRLIGAALIDSIDEAGYLRGDIGELAARLGVALDEILDVLRVVQGFEPTGVAARDLAECLRLQLQEQGRCDPAIEALLANLDLVARRDIAGLCTACGVDSDDVADMIA